jgi:hypothetical protein
MFTVEGMSANSVVMSVGGEMVWRVGAGWCSGWRAWV